MRGSIPYYGASGVVDHVNQYLFDEDLILLGEDGENILSRVVPLAFKVSGKCWVNNHAHVLRPRSDFDIDFLTAYLESLDYSGLNTGTAQPKLNKQSCLSVQVAKPPLEEQRRIAEALSDTDGQITALERLITKKQAIKRGMMQQLLTGRTRLPGFADEWTDIRLGDHVSYVKTVALSRAQLDAKSPLKYLHYGDIHTRSSVLLDAVAEEMPRASALLAGRAGQLRCGDLVFADASEDPAGVGKSVEIVDVPSGGVVPGLHTIAARFDKSVLADGFKAYLQFIPAFREQLLRLAAGTKVLATTRSYISSVILTLPDVTEQKAIAEVLHDSEREIDALRIRLSKARDMKTGMMQQLLTGRTRLPVEVSS
ncbi:type I restriction enzyme S protein [Gordonia amicalis NBRC 100051 = JCM 11271]|nr:type I restriction enzyme S protein [Gordonia amicalis NBRC 100051 = JCM 11271]